MGDRKFVFHSVVRKPAEFNLPKNEVDTEAEMHAEEIRRARFSRVQGIPSEPEEDAAQRSSPERFFEIS